MTRIKLSEVPGITPEQVELIREAAKLFNAQRVFITDVKEKKLCPKIRKKSRR